MGIPLVTRVGDQFAARNSYTMMMNAGITEGIAWTDEEYVEWGIRLGKEPALRSKLPGSTSVQTSSPLWDAKAIYPRDGKRLRANVENSHALMVLLANWLDCRSVRFG
jgi:predicted O-linked N-acetylglucosamine transferase (SPINDLY family)